MRKKKENKKMKLTSDLLNKLGNYSLAMNKDIVVIDGDIKITLNNTDYEKVLIYDFMRSKDFEKVIENFDDIELEKVSDTEYKEKGLD